MSRASSGKHTDFSAISLLIRLKPCWLMEVDSVAARAIKMIKGGNFFKKNLWRQTSFRRPERFISYMLTKTVILYPYIYTQKNSCTFILIRTQTLFWFSAEPHYWKQEERKKKDNSWQLRYTNGLDIILWFRGSCKQQENHYITPIWWSAV